MKFILTADLHLSSYGGDEINKESNLPERLHFIIISLENMIEYAIDNKISNLIVAGDIFHNKSIIYSIAQSNLLDLVRKYKSINFILLDGNHDMSSKSTNSISSLKSLDSEENVHTIHEIEQIENVLFVPWKYVSRELFSTNSTDYLISHFGVNEGKLSSGVSLVSDISSKDLINFKYVLLGHYHKNQNFIFKETEIYYVGSPIQLDWGEKSEEKRFLVVDTNKNEIKSIPTTGYKKHFEFKVDKSNINDVLETISVLREQGHHVKIRKTEDVDTSKIESTIIVIDDTELDITNRGINSSMSMADKIDKFMEVKGVSPDCISLFKKVALDIIDEASQIK